MDTTLFPAGTGGLDLGQGQISVNIARGRTEGPQLDFYDPYSVNIARG